VVLLRVEDEAGGVGPTHVDLLCLTLVDDIEVVEVVQVGHNVHFFVGVSIQQLFQFGRVLDVLLLVHGHQVKG